MFLPKFKTIPQVLGECVCTILLIKMWGYRCVFPGKEMELAFISMDANVFHR